MGGSWWSGSLPSLFNKRVNYAAISTVSPTLTRNCDQFSSGQIDTLVQLFSGEKYSDGSWIITKYTNFVANLTSIDGSQMDEVQMTLIRCEVNRASILMVTNEEYDKCKSSHPMFISNNSDNTVFKIDKPWLFYFISEVAGHCDQGLKMIVKVLEPESSPPPGLPPPTPPSSTTESSSTIGVAVKEAGIISSSAAVVLPTMSFCGALFFM